MRPALLVLRRDFVVVPSVRHWGIDLHVRAMAELDVGRGLTLRPQGGDCGRVRDRPRILLCDRFRDS